MGLIIQMVGYLLLWVSTDIGRGPESKIEIFSFEWWLILVLITIGTMLSCYEITPN